MFAQDRHEATLREHLEKTFGLSVELNTELVSFEQYDRGVKARLVKKAPNGEGVEEVFDTPYLVGADGAHSIVRKQLGLSFLGGEEFDTTVVVGDIWAKGLDYTVCVHSRLVRRTLISFSIGTLGVIEEAECALLYLN